MAKPKMTEQELLQYLEDNSDMIFGTDYLYGNICNSHFEKINKINFDVPLDSLETIKNEQKI